MIVLSVIDEWDRSLRAYRKHFVFTDGTGGAAKLGFREIRAYLYPRK